MTLGKLRQSLPVAMRFEMLCFFVPIHDAFSVLYIQEDKYVPDAGSETET